MRNILLEAFDMSSVKPSSPGNQRITYSIYYKGNVAKGDVTLQLGGWIRVECLWCGGTSDDQYMIKSKIFEKQKEFQESDLQENDKILVFINVLDRGYRLALHAFRCGKQIVRQPVFKRKNRRFTGHETLKSASIAGIRSGSGNERAVRKAKLCGWLAKGLNAKECPRRFDNVWLAWGFMVNFMYKPNT